MHSQVSRMLYLARHGETAWNAQGRFQGLTDIPLNEAGRAQARALAQRVRGLVTRVVASDLLRAAETGRIVAEELGVPFEGIDPGLRERGFGCFEGLTRDECETQQRAAWAAWVSADRVVPPGGEVAAAVAERMLAAIRRVMKDPSTPLVVTHGGAIRLMLRHSAGLQLPPVANATVFAATYLHERIQSVRELR